MYSSLTTSESHKRRAVVFPHPVCTSLEQQPDGSGGRVELVDLQSLNHLPVATCKEGEGGGRFMQECYRCTQPNLDWGR